MKKKWVVYLLALMMAVSVTGCGENAKKEPDVETEAGDNEENNTTDNKETGEETGTTQESLPEETLIKREVVRFGLPNRLIPTISLVFASFQESILLAIPGSISVTVG